MTPSQVSAIALTPWAILTATAGLIAFHIGFYTLVGRERKSPYVINRVFPTFLLCLAVAASALSWDFFDQEYQESILKFSLLLLIIAFIWSFLVVWRAAVRFVYFVDSIRLKQLPLIRQTLLWIKLRRHTPSYEHNPVQLPKDIKDEITKIISSVENKSFSSCDSSDARSLSINSNDREKSDYLLRTLAEWALKRGYAVQYLSAYRHPYEFITALQASIEKNGEEWRKCAGRIKVIDAYSPHFGFLDSIFPKKQKELEALGVTCIRSTMTFAGIHSAASKAFNMFKAQDGGKLREPTLVIYEGAYALSDLESPEQYRIFVRHVAPSERAFGGMFTVFSEAGQPDTDWNLLQSYTDMRLDLRSSKQETPSVKSESVTPFKKA